METRMLQETSTASLEPFLTIVVAYLLVLCRPHVRIAPDLLPELSWPLDGDGIPVA